MVDSLSTSESLPLITVGSTTNPLSDNAAPIFYDPDYDPGDGTTQKFRLDAGAELPVTFVSYFGARLFATYYGYDLPTTTQWDFAASGFAGSAYPSGITVDCGTNSHCDSTATVVVTANPNTPPEGLDTVMHMHDNVAEWVRDWQPYIHKGASAPAIDFADAKDPLNNVGHNKPGHNLEINIHRKTIKGGDYTQTATTLTNNQQANFAHPDHMDPKVGFRIASRMMVAGTGTSVSSDFGLTSDPQYNDHSTYMHINCNGTVCEITAEACDSSCETCDGPGADDCVSCHPGQDLGSAGNCSCKAGFTDCGDALSPGLDANGCRGDQYYDATTILTTVDGFTTSGCVDCPVGTRDCDATGQNGVCNVSATQLPDDCTCQFALQFIGFFCENPPPYCPYNTFNAEYACVPCDANCSRCSGILSTDCLDCPAKRQFATAGSTGGACTCVDNAEDSSGDCYCNVGFIYEETTNSCVQGTCDVNCDTCREQATACVTCKPGLHLITESTLGGEPAGRCECEDPLATLGSDNETCTCPAKRMLSGQFCVCIDNATEVAGDCECGVGYVWDEANGVCTALTCAETCATCISQADYCVTCTGILTFNQDATGAGVQEIYGVQVGTCQCPSADQTYSASDDTCNCPTGTSLNSTGRCGCPVDVQRVNSSTFVCECPANSFQETMASTTATAGTASLIGTITWTEVCTCGASSGDGLSDILIMEYDQANDSYACVCRDSALTYNADLKRCECPDGYTALSGQCVCQAPRAVQLDQALNRDICTCTGDNQVYVETTNTCDCAAGYTMDTATLTCGFTPIENCKTQTSSTDCTECLEGIAINTNAVTGENPCSCGINKEYRSVDEFGATINPGCYCVSGYTGDDCTSDACASLHNGACLSCYEAYPDKCLECKANIVVGVGDVAEEFIQELNHSINIYTCNRECAEGYRWVDQAQICEAMTCDSACAAGKCAYAEDLCTECVERRVLTAATEEVLIQAGAPNTPTFTQAGSCLCITGYNEGAITNTAGTQTKTCDLANTCYFKCATCYQWDDPQACLTCNDDYILQEIGTVGGQCVFPDNVGTNYYIETDADGSNPRLKACDARCSGCFGPTNLQCEACADASQDRSNTTGCQCPGCQQWMSTTVTGSTELTFECRSTSCATEGYYGATCTAACDISCKCCEGEGATQCIGCRDNAYIADATTAVTGTNSYLVGSCQCNAHYYMDTATGNCELCSPVCIVCTGSSKAACDSNECNWPAQPRSDGQAGCACPADMTVNSDTTNREQPCTCTNADYKFDYTTGQCVNNDTGCPNGQYAANGTCQLCVWPCLTCNNADTCNECYSPYLPSATTTIATHTYLKNCVCQDGTYFDATTCLPCTNPCKTCIGSSQNQC